MADKPKTEQTYSHRNPLAVMAKVHDKLAEREKEPAKAYHRQTATKLRQAAYKEPVPDGKA